MILLFACKRIASYWALCFSPCYNRKRVLQASRLVTKLTYNRKNICVALLTTETNNKKIKKVMQIAATCRQKYIRLMMVQRHRHKTLRASAERANNQS